MIELKPCPFCGREIYDYSLKIENGMTDELNVSCRCGANFHIRGSKVYGDNKRIYITTAIDVWNRRAENG